MHISVQAEYETVNFVTFGWQTGLERTQKLPMGMEMFSTPYKTSFLQNC